MCTYNKANNQIKESREIFNKVGSHTRNSSQLTQLKNSNFIPTNKYSQIERLFLHICYVYLHKKKVIVKIWKIPCPRDKQWDGT
jgi:hypothetical protein